MNTNRFLYAVAEFHRAMNHRQPEPVAPDLSDRKINDLRPSLIKEELFELRDAVDANNRLEQLDALCDCQYVISGSVLDWGYRSMFSQYTIAIDMRPVRDVTRHIAQMIGITNTMGVAAHYEYASQVLADLVALQSKLLVAVNHLGFGEVFSQAFEVVHANNLGKIWSNEQMLASRTEPGFLESMGVESITFDESPNGWIARREDGKILKPNGFVKVGLEGFI